MAGVWGDILPVEGVLWSVVGARAKHDGGRQAPTVAPRFDAKVI